MGNFMESHHLKTYSRLKDNIKIDLREMGCGGG
jgi:hypothetical protein